MPTENRYSTIKQHDHIEGIIDMVSVPRFPTDEMIVAFAESWYSKRQAIDDPDMLDAYAAMIAVAPVPQPCPEPIAWMIGTAIWWQKPGAERDSAERGEPMVPLGPCDSPSEVARLTAQFKEWQASNHRNYCKGADERDELRGQLEQARLLLHTASISLANWLEPGDEPTPALTPRRWIDERYRL